MTGSQNHGRKLPVQCASCLQHFNFTVPHDQDNPQRISQVLTGATCRGCGAVGRIRVHSARLPREGTRLDPSDLTVMSPEAQQPAGTDSSQPPVDASAPTALGLVRPPTGRHSGRVSQPPQVAAFTGGPSSPPPPPQVAGVHLQPVLTLAGRQVNGVQVDRRIGEGGMGEVFSGRHILLGSPRAIKSMTLEGTGEQIRRFQAEAEALERLHHPNICRFYDIVETGPGEYAIIMELVDGQDLKSMERNFSTAEIARILRDAARALQVAYSKGIIHKDIKPHNIMLTRGGRVVKIMDFGLVTLLDRRLMEAPAGHAIEGLRAAEHTKSGVGTLTYMPPEVLGNMEERIRADPRFDVFGLAGVAIFLLTGKPPYPQAFSRPGFRVDLHDAFQRKRGEKAQAHLQKREPYILGPASRKAGLGDLADKPFQAILECLSEEDPDRRYDTCGAAAEDLDIYLASQEEGFLEHRLLEIEAYQTFLRENNRRELWRLRLKGWMASRRVRIASLLAVAATLLVVVAIKGFSYLQEQAVISNLRSIAAVSSENGNLGQAANFYSQAHALSGDTGDREDAEKAQEMFQTQVRAEEQAQTQERERLRQLHTHYAQLTLLLRLKQYEGARGLLADWRAFLAANPRILERDGGEYRNLASLQRESLGVTTFTLLTGSTQVNFSLGKILKDCTYEGWVHRGSYALQAERPEHSGQSDTSLDVLPGFYHVIFTHAGTEHVTEIEVLPGTPLELTFPLADVPEGMVYIPPGDYVTSDGARNNMRYGYYIDRDEVTIRQFNDLLVALQARGGHNPAWCHQDEPANFRHGISGSLTFPLPGTNQQVNYVSDPQGRFLDFPVVGVSWFDAFAYARFRGKRLPHLAESARALWGLQGRRYPRGDTRDLELYNLPGSTAARESPFLRSGTGAESVCGVRNLVGNVGEFLEPYSRSQNSERVIAIFGGSNTRPLRFFADGRFQVEAIGGDFTRARSTRFTDIGFRCVKPTPRD